MSLLLLVPVPTTAAALLPTGERQPSSPRAPQADASHLQRVHPGRLREPPEPQLGRPDPGGARDLRPLEQGLRVAPGICSRALRRSRLDTDCVFHPHAPRPAFPLPSRPASWNEGHARARTSRPPWGPAGMRPGPRCWDDSSFCSASSSGKNFQKRHEFRMSLESLFQGTCSVRSPGRRTLRGRHSWTGQEVRQRPGRSQDRGHRHGSVPAPAGHGQATQMGAVAVKAKPRWFRGRWADGAETGGRGLSQAQEGGGRLRTGRPARAARAAGHPAPRPGRTARGLRAEFGVGTAALPLSAQVCWDPGRPRLLFL